MAENERLPLVEPIHPASCREAFDDPAWTFDFKYDGFRGLLYLEGGRAWFVSKQRKPMPRFRGLAVRVAGLVKADRAIFDGEIVASDPSERPIFSALLQSGSELTYVAFDLLFVGDKDMRSSPLKERRRRLRRLFPLNSSVVKEAFTYPEYGVATYRAMCSLDLEGIIAKRLTDPYTKCTKWYKIKNPDYSQAVGRNQIFNRRRS